MRERCTSCSLFSIKGTSGRKPEFVASPRRYGWINAFGVRKCSDGTSKRATTTRGTRSFEYEIVVDDSTECSVPREYTYRPS